MNRRDFLQLTSQTGMLALLGSMGTPWKAFAQAPGTRIKNLIYVHFNAGWDVTLGLDPQIKSADLLKFSDSQLFLGYRPEEIVQAGGLRFGPSAKLLAPMASNCVVVNGVSMLGNVAHDECSRWAQTGVLERITAGMPAMLQSSLTAPEETAGVIGPDQNGFEAGTLDVALIGADQVATESANQSAPEQFLEEDSHFARAMNTLAQYGQKLKKERDENPLIDSAFKAEAANGFNDQPFFASLAVSFLTGYTRASVWNISSAAGVNASLDSHSNHKRDHAQVQSAYFKRVVELANFLKQIPGLSGGSLFDETLIVVSSDFSREINLNGSNVATNGKEHNGYTNSYLLLSGGLRGGYTIGSSHLTKNILRRPLVHAAHNFDFAKGRVIREHSDAPELMNKKGAIKQIRPGHVVRTIASLVGFESKLEPNLEVLPKLPIRV